MITVRRGEGGDPSVIGYWLVGTHEGRPPGQHEHPLGVLPNGDQEDACCRACKLLWINHKSPLWTEPAGAPA